MRILIADDEYLSRRVLAEAARAYGEVESVASGEEAVAAFRLAHDEQRPFRLILLDIEMPGIDGHVALRRIRDEEAGLGLAGRQAASVVMTTVRDDPRSVFSSFRDQAEGYLIKPVTAPMLYDELVRLGLITRKS
jgi:two-component system chemotaxis response regulator CheY